MEMKGDKTLLIFSLSFQLRPWNVDTISKDGFSRTLINSLPPPVDKSSMTDEEREQYMREFVKKNEEKIKQFGWLAKFEDSRKFLMENNFLACEETANYLVIQCINLAMEEVRGGKDRVFRAHSQSQSFREPPNL